MPKFPLTGPVSDDPDWPRHFALAAALGLMLLIPTMVGVRRLPALRWLGLAAGATAAASLLVLGFRAGLLGSRTMYDWMVFAVRWLSAAERGGAGPAGAVARHGRRRRSTAADRGADRGASRRRRLPARPWRADGAGRGARGGAVRRDGDHPLPRLRSTLPRLRECACTPSRPSPFCSWRWRRGGATRRHPGGRSGRGETAGHHPGGQAGSRSRSGRGSPIIRRWPGRRWPCCSRWPSSSTPPAGRVAALYRRTMASAPSSSAARRRFRNVEDQAGGARGDREQREGRAPRQSASAPAISAMNPNRPKRIDVDARHPQRAPPGRRQALARPA